MTLPVYADVLRPAARGVARVYDAALIAGFSVLVALSAQIAIPLPFTPVPVTLQTFMVLATGALLGSKRGAAAILLYLGEGLAGLPVFQSGHLGIAYFFGPTGGYLIGFVAAAFIAGLLAEKGWDRKWLTAIAALFIADIVLFITGVLWLGVYTGFSNALVLGTLPFAAVDAVKVIACASLLPLGWKALSRKE
jgi:biotin transport system substrate-specific component